MNYGILYDKGIIQALEIVPVNGIKGFFETLKASVNDFEHKQNAVHFNGGLSFEGMVPGIGIDGRIDILRYKRKAMNYKITVRKANYVSITLSKRN